MLCGSVIELGLWLLVTIGIGVTAVVTGVTDDVTFLLSQVVTLGAAHVTRACRDHERDRQQRGRV